MFTLQKMCPISSVDSYYDELTGRLLLLIADEMGLVRIQEISSIISEFKLVPIDVTRNNFKRNPWRVLAIDKAETGNYSDSNEVLSDTSSHNGDREVEPLLKEF